MSEILNDKNLEELFFRAMRRALAHAENLSKFNPATGITTTMTGQELIDRLEAAIADYQIDNKHYSYDQSHHEKVTQKIDQLRNLQRVLVATREYTVTAQALESIR